jgi:hypothetical protein
MFQFVTPEKDNHETVIAISKGCLRLISIDRRCRAAACPPALRELLQQCTPAPLSPGIT